MKVLDIACGVGYGSFLMAKDANEVIGVDISEEAIEAANIKYKHPNLIFKTGSTDDIPVGDNYFDIVVSFETIEHHDRHDEMLSEIKRVLKSGGLLIISSPDKLNYSDVRNYKNPFHKKELYEDEFKNLLNKYFKNTLFLRQQSTYCSRIIPNVITGYVEYEGDFNSVQEKENLQPLFIVAVASDELIGKSNIPLSIFREDRFLDTLVNETILKYKNSKSYKIGHFILLPIRLIREGIKLLLKK